MKALIYGLLLLMLAADAAAAGIGAAPSELKFSIEEGGRQSRQLTVYNLNDGPTEIAVESNASFLSFNYTGVIEGQGSAKVIVEADAAGLEAGEHRSLIYVSTLNGRDGVNFRIGAAVRATVTVAEGRTAGFAIALLVLVVLAAGGVLLAYLSAAGVRMFMRALRG